MHSEWGAGGQDRQAGLSGGSGARKDNDNNMSESHSGYWHRLDYPQAPSCFCENIFNPDHESCFMCFKCLLICSVWWHYGGCIPSHI